jgi:methionyl aminopeptidase
MQLTPHVEHVERRGAGLRLCAGMAFTIEPMFTEGRADTAVRDDGRTVVTADGRRSAPFEHTVLVTDDGVEVPTRLSP